MKYVLFAVLFAYATAVVIRSNAAVQCDFPWRYFDFTNSCYYAGDNQNFHQAEMTCNSLGGHLASIHNNFENQYVMSLTETGEKEAIDGMTWIGLNYNKTWQWSDGSALDYTYWMPKAPGKNSAGQCGILMQDDYSHTKGVKGYWDDTSCTNRMRKYVCKKAPNF